MSKLFGKRTLRLLEWQDILKCKEWFENNIELTKGKTRGMFDTSQAPHLGFIFDLADKTHIRRITLRVASQTQKTTVSLGMLMYWIDTDYHDMFYMIPRAKDIKKFLKFKIEPFIDGCVTVKRKLTAYRQDEKERKNSFFYQTLTNLFAVISANDTKSITTKYGVFDEAAEMPIEVIEEALERFKDYGADTKVLIVSTQIHDDDAINYYYNSSEIYFRYNLTCIHCGDNFYPMPKDLIIVSEDDFKIANNIDVLSESDIMSDYIPYASRNAYLQCPKCNAKITNKDKNKAILNNMCEWVSVKQVITDEDGSVEYVEVNQKEYYETVGLDLNSMLSPRVSLQVFAEKELTCRYASPLKQKQLYDKFYVGYWNQIYKSKTDVAVTRNEVLKLCDGSPFGVVPDNTSTIHLGVDLQKNRLYYTLNAVEYAQDMEYDDGIVMHTFQYGELYSDFSNQDIIQLKEILNTTYKDKQGNNFRIYSAGCDIMGFSQEDKDSRSNMILDFIFEYANTLREYGVIDWDNFIHPMYGVDKFTNITRENQGYFVKKIERVIKDEKIQVNAIAFSNIRIKTIQQNMIERSIEKHDNKKCTFSTNLLYITQEAQERYEERQLLAPKDRLEKHSLESHLSSEHLTYIEKNGKLTNIRAYTKKYDSVRNDYWDCNCMCIAQILKHGTHKIKKISDAKKIDVSSNMKKLFS